MHTSRLPGRLTCTALLLLASCADVTRPESPAIPQVDDAAPSALSALQPAGIHAGTVKLLDGHGAVTRSFAITWQDLRSTPPGPDVAHLQKTVQELGRANSREARAALALASGSAAEKHAATAAYRAGVSVHPDVAPPGRSARQGSIRRGNQDWIVWALEAAEGRQVGGSPAPNAPGANRAERVGTSSPDAGRMQVIAGMGGCLDCGGIDEDYDPNYDPYPAVMEMASVFAFTADLEATASMSGTPEECYGYRTAFVVSLSTTISAAAFATLSAYARMPVSTYNFTKLAGQGALATYVAWEFLESCKVQFRKK